MTELKLTTTNYAVSYNAEGGIKAEGNLTVNGNKSINQLYVNVTENDQPVGTANYTTYEGGANASYSFSDESKKDIVIAASDAILADVKQQLTL